MGRQIVVRPRRRGWSSISLYSSGRSKSSLTCMWPLDLDL